MNEHTRLAAIVFSGEQTVDDVLLRVASRLIAAGYSVSGVHQSAERRDGQCCPMHHAVLLDGAGEMSLSQELGRGAVGCRLDPEALGRLGGHLLDLLDVRPDLMVLNRFGRGESTGAGLRPVIERACDLDVPVLLAVRDTYLGAWRDYTCGMAAEYRPDDPAIDDWAMNAVRTRRDTVLHALSAEQRAC